MRKLAEKIAVIAQICITLIFALTAVLYMSNVIPQNDNYANNGVFTILFAVLGAVYLLLSAYLIYVNFSDRENIKRVMLYCDSESATLTNTRVVKNIVRDCAKQVGGVSVKKAKIKTDENNGFVLYLKVNVTADTVSEPVDKLHCLLADSFSTVLGITFNSINFEVSKLRSGYVPSGKKAQEQADTIAEYREQDAEHYHEPLPNHAEEETDGETALSAQDGEVEESDSDAE